MNVTMKPYLHYLCMILAIVLSTTALPSDVQSRSSTYRTEYCTGKANKLGGYKNFAWADTILTQRGIDNILFSRLERYHCQGAQLLPSHLC